MEDSLKIKNGPFTIWLMRGRSNALWVLRVQEKQPLLGCVTISGKQKAMRFMDSLRQEKPHRILEQSGIPSTTLHKFLKSFEEGRCQYNPNSVLVLDEAGMVDMERFEKLLGAVKQLGVKLIVVGDGAQLQPVEAGPAFRLVTTRLGKG